MTGPLLDVVAVFCKTCGRAQTHRVENEAAAREQPCWWCRHGIALPKTPRCLDAAATIPKTVDQ